MLRGSVFQGVAGLRVSALHLLAAISLFCVGLAAHAATLTLAWDPVAGASGYSLHWGTASGVYTNQVDAGAATNRAVTGLPDGVAVYIVVRARDDAGNSSSYSNEVSTTTPAVAPVANFIVSTTSGTAPLSVNFTSTSTGVITSYSWTFGDGSTSTAQNPSKTYATAGSYTVSLTVNGPGGSNTRTNTGYMNVGAPTDTSAPSVPGGVVASASGTSAINLSWSASTDNVGVAGYRVERCQGANCTSFTQVGTPGGTSYNSAGLSAGTIYRFRVRAADAAGNLSGYSSVATATTGTAVVAPVASFSATPTTGTAPLVVHFTSTSTGAITSYSWSFGDGTTSTAQNPSRTYAAPGDYTVSLTVTGPGGSHTATRTGYIDVTTVPLALEDRGVLMDMTSGTGTTSNRNGIIEPGESVRIVPVWGAVTGSASDVTASARVSGPSGARYTLNDSTARYGTVNAGDEVDCDTATGNCYRLTVSNPAVRPALRWTVLLTETLSTGAVHSRELHIGKSFPDVPVTDIMYPYVEALVHHRVTLGNQGRFVPTGDATRAQTAMLIARAYVGGDGDDDIPDSGVVPAGAYNCVAGGVSRFADIKPTDSGCKQVHYLAARGVNIAHACTPGNRACPAVATSRATTAVYVAGAIAPGGDAGVPVAGTFNDTGVSRSYNCATTGGGHFPDVPSSAAYCRHVNYLWARGIIDGYADGTFQPGLDVARSQMAKFVSNAFRLGLR